MSFSLPLRAAVISLLSFELGGLTEGGWATFNYTMGALWAVVAVGDTVIWAIDRIDRAYGLK